MKKKTKIWIICGSIFGTVAVATAVAVPCALLLNKEKVIDDFVFIGIPLSQTDGNYEDFLSNYVYKDINNWLSFENRIVSLPFEYQKKLYNNDPVKLNMFRLFYDSERIIDSSNNQKWKSFIDKSSIELIEGVKFSYFDNPNVDQQQLDYNVYKITTRSTWVDLEIKFPPCVNGQSNSFPHEVTSTQTNLENTKVFSYYYAVNKYDTSNWWDLDWT